jgi:hypothetical protein
LLNQSSVVSDPPHGHKSVYPFSGPPADASRILRDMWRTPRGRLCARKLGFQELTYAESLRLPLILLGAEFVHQTAMPRELSAEQEQVCGRRPSKSIWPPWTRS